MCWQGHITDKHIAKEDVTVFKVMYRREKGWHCYDAGYKETYISPYMCNRYVLGKDYTSYHSLYPERYLEGNNDAVKIEKGYHSYSPDYCVFGYSLSHLQLVVSSNFGNLEDLHHHPMCRYSSSGRFIINGKWIDCDAIVVECVIPAGSEYWVNGQGEVVSNIIRLVREIKI
jgi:hypothetical protein